MEGVKKSGEGEGGVEGVKKSGEGEGGVEGGVERKGEGREKRGVEDGVRGV